MNVEIIDTDDQQKYSGTIVKIISKSDDPNGIVVLISNGREGHISIIIDPHNDHRMAMSFALIGLKISGIKINNPGCVNKSFPGFWKKLEEIGVEIVK